MNRKHIGIVLLCVHGLSWGQSTTPAQLLQGYGLAAAQAPQPGRGQLFFNQAHGKDWSCSTCHTQQPTSDGQHASTRKTISPLAPAANVKRFRDEAKTEKWFRRNCNDVLGRECTASEKADVLAWLISLKP